MPSFPDERLFQQDRDHAREQEKRQGDFGDLEGAGLI